MRSNYFTEKPVPVPHFELCQRAHSFARDHVHCDQYLSQRSPIRIERQKFVDGHIGALKLRSEGEEVCTRVSASLDEFHFGGAHRVVRLPYQAGEASPTWKLVRTRGAGPEN